MYAGNTKHDLDHLHLSVHTLTTVTSHARSPDMSPIDGPYTSFYRQSVVTLALDGFISEISLVLYSKCNLCTYPLMFHPKFRDICLELNQ